MNPLRTMPLPLSIGMLLGAQMWAEMLPECPVEWCTLEAQLIVEGRLTSEGKAVRVEKVHFGKAEPGEAIPVERLDKLPMIAYQDYHMPGSRDGEGLPVAGGLAVLFLVRQEGRDGMAPFGWGSGVKWVVNGTVYGYMQPMNPGPYVLVPEKNSVSLDALRSAIAVGLKKRTSFEVALAIPDLRVRAQRLASFIEPEQPYYYFGKVVAELAKLGNEGALVLQREADRPAQKKHRRDLLIAIGRSRDKLSVPYLVGVVRRARPTLNDLSGPFVWSQVSEQTREAMADWQTAVYSLAEIGDERALPEFREAATWGAVHSEQQMVEYGVRGMATTPTEENLPCFRSVFSALPRSTNGIGRFGAYYTLLSLIAHKYLDAAPLLISQLDHPDEYNRRQARRGLTELAGKDLGDQATTWLKWYDEQKQQRER